MCCAARQCIWVARSKQTDVKSVRGVWAGRKGGLSARCAARVRGRTVVKKGEERKAKQSCVGARACGEEKRG